MIPTRCGRSTLNPPQMTNTEGAAIEARLRSRLRQPANASTVPGSLAVLFFGDPRAARVATVGLNPSLREYVETPRGTEALVELDGARRRFETLASVDASSRAELRDEQCDRAIETMRRYFDPGRPSYGWFRHLGNVLSGMGLSYVDRTAVHLDFVQEATHPTWSRLKREYPNEADALWQRDMPFLRWQLGAYKLRGVVCNGRTVYGAASVLMRCRAIRSGVFHKLKWWIGVSGFEGSRRWIAGWNLALARAGLRAGDEVELGRVLADGLHLEGLDW